MDKKRYRAIGLMSGSSLDGLDIACCEFELIKGRLKHWKIIQATTIDFSIEWKQSLLKLPSTDAFTFCKAHAEFGHYTGKMVNSFIEAYQLKPDLIASHGHTVFHYPDLGFTTQIGDGAAIAAETGCLTIDNFRAMDIALGGQGAPLAPLADKFLFSKFDFCLNIGGIANISFNAAGNYRAFDIGGANQILNALSQQLGKTFDDKGGLARSGKLEESLLKKVEKLPFFQLPYPKSLGNNWVREEMLPVFLSHECSTVDKLHTACVQLARQTAFEISRLLELEKAEEKVYRMLVSGGGAYNKFLLEQIKYECQKICSLAIEIPSRQIINFKEAALMALMGVLRYEGINNCIRSVTGANRNAIGGTVHLAG